jgi:hypothetical protein
VLTARNGGVEIGSKAAREGGVNNEAIHRRRKRERDRGREREREREVSTKAMFVRRSMKHSALFLSLSE